MESGASSSLSGSDSSCGRAKNMQAQDVTQTCLWDGRTEDQFTQPEYRYVIAMEDRAPDAESDHLAFEKGDYLQVLAQIDGQWLYCTCGRQEGLVPLPCVRPLTDHEVFETLNDNFYH
jgi:hypothetical protein